MNITSFFSHDTNISLKSTKNDTIARPCSRVELVENIVRDDGMEELASRDLSLQMKNHNQKN